MNLNACKGEKQKFTEISKECRISERTEIPRNPHKTGIHPGLQPKPLKESQQNDPLQKVTPHKK